ncbi:MAG: hypothetical protein L3J83_08155 [Proteobacteria bacterium]|nr:hypothetical protein [Pseudomonadota bacterium]
MKTNYILFVSVLSILILGCEAPIEPTQHIVSVAIDQTEGNAFKQSGDFILNDLKTTPLSDGIELSLIPISDTRYNSKQSFVLNTGATGWMANDDSRRNERKYLFKRFKDSLSVLNSSETILERSDIFRVVTAELNALASKTGQRKLFVFSDLKEHSSVFSVYSPKQLRLLYRNPKAVVSIFESSVALADDLSDIIVVIVYKPTLEDEALFSGLVLLYKMILESRGAIVSVGYHNTITI